MSRARALVAAALAVWAVAGLAGVASYANHYAVYRGFPVPRHPAGVPAGKLVQVRFFSRALGRERSYTVALPPGYAAAAAQGRRFPVLYMLHGTSGSPRLMLGAGAVQLRLDTLLAQGQVRPFIVVLPDGRDGTMLSDTEWANTAHGSYEGLVLDTVRAVDARWSSVPDRTGRAIAGLSEGGYGAVNLALRHLGLFSVVESWSGYFGQSPTGPFRGAAAAAVRANSPQAYVDGLGATLHRHKLHALVYAGAHDPARKGQAAFAQRLRAAGADVSDRTYPGKHDWRLWRGQMTHMLRYAGSELGRGR